MSFVFVLGIFLEITGQKMIEAYQRSWMLMKGVVLFFALYFFISGRALL